MALPAGDIAVDLARVLLELEQTQHEVAQGGHQVGAIASAGSVLVFNPMLAHSSGPNNRRIDPDNHRRVLQVEFRPVGSRPTPELGWYRWRNNARLEIAREITQRIEDKQCESI